MRPLHQRGLAGSFSLKGGCTDGERKSKPRRAKKNVGAPTFKVKLEAYSVW
jgi:hypothetical protein